MNLRNTLKINTKGHLEIGGADCCDLVEKFGTPLYVLDESYIRGVLGAFKNTIEETYGLGTVAYASKAFSATAIYKIVDECNCSCDAVSSGEIFTALRAGFSAEKMYFHGNNKLVGEIDFAIKNNVGKFVIDSLDEIALVDECAENYGKIQKVLIRVNPGVEAHTHKFIQTATVDSKFGFGLANGDARVAIAKILECRNLKFEGLHCHIGSQIFDKNAFAVAVDTMTDYMKTLSEDGIIVDELNMGGGFGVYYNEEDPKFSLSDYCDYVKTLTSRLNQAITVKKLKKPFLTIEPGRSVVAEAGITLYSVGNIKEIVGLKKYISIDGGMTDNIRPALYQAKYEAILANKANEKAVEKVSIAGKCCESGDIIIENISLPKAERGDIVAVFSTGAYNYSMASNYNRNLVPPVVLVNNGDAEYIVRPQNLEDLVRNDVLPKRFTK